MSRRVRAAVLVVLRTAAALKAQQRPHDAGDPAASHHSSLHQLTAANVTLPGSAQEVAMIDRYTKGVLTLIAAGLVYLCVVLTPMPAVHAQFTQRPGEPTGPVQVVVVGWRAPDRVPIVSPAPLAVTVNGLVEVRGQVKTESASDLAQRVVLAGWETGGTRENRSNGFMNSFTATSSLPVNVKQ